MTLSEALNSSRGYTLGWTALTSSRLSSFSLIFHKQTGTIILLDKLEHIDHLDHWLDTYPKNVYVFGELSKEHKEDFLLWLVDHGVARHKHHKHYLHPLLKVELTNEPIHVKRNQIGWMEASLPHMLRFDGPNYDEDEDDEAFGTREARIIVWNRSPFAVLLFSDRQETRAVSKNEFIVAGTVESQDWSMLRHLYVKAPNQPSAPRESALDRESKKLAQHKKDYEERRAKLLQDKFARNQESDE